MVQSDSVNTRYLIENAEKESEIQQQRNNLLSIIYLRFMERAHSLIPKFVEDKILQPVPFQGCQATIPYDIMLIQGETGSGKSILMRDIENYYWHNPSIKNAEGYKFMIIPILVKLSFIKNADDCLFEALYQRLQNTELVRDILQSARKQKNNPNRLLILFDGLDEMRRPVDLYKANHLEDYNCKVIITSRNDLTAYKGLTDLFEDNEKA